MASSRGAYRFPVELQAWVHVSERLSAAARVVNLSRTGAGLWVSEPAVLSERLECGVASVRESNLAVGQSVRLAVADVVGGRPVARQWRAHVCHAGPPTAQGERQVGLSFQTDREAGPGDSRHEDTADLPWPLSLLPAEPEQTRGRKGATSPADALAAHVALAALALDQATKAAAWAWVASPGASGEGLFEIVPRLLAVAPVANAGAVAGLADGLPFTARICALAALALAALVPGWSSHRPAMKPTATFASSLGCGLLTAGLLGNATDRLALGFVRDFLVCGLIPGCTYNLADVELVIGALVLISTRLGRNRDTVS